MLEIKGLDLQYVSDEGGRRVGVIIPIDKFEELVEDIEDLAAIGESRAESTVAHGELISELRRGGLL
jgi:hypothetical protein